MNGTNLLEVVNFDDTIKNTHKGRMTPQLLEFQVNADLAPFLVSSTRSVMWIDKAGTQDQVRAAVRDRRGLESEIIVAIAEMGARARWGNVQPLTTAGIRQLRDHLAFYELKDVECLVAPDTSLEGVDFKDLNVIEAPWVPLDAVVMIPVDRGYVGTLGTLGQNKALALVHNASRGVGVAHR